MTPYDEQHNPININGQQLAASNKTPPKQKHIALPIFANTKDKAKNIPLASLGTFLAK